MTTVLPSCLTLVNRVLLECGIPTVASLNPGTRQSNVALEALNDGTNEITLRERWPWRRVTTTIPLIAGTNAYPLPDDFKTLAEAARFGGTNIPFISLQELTPENWVYYGQGASLNSSITGTPTQFTIKDNSIYFYPTPSAGFIAIYPTITFAYFKGVHNRRTVTDDANSWDLPADMYDCLVKYGKARLKEYLEYPDAQLNQQQYEMALRMQMAIARQGRKPAQMRPMNAPFVSW